MSRQVIESADGRAVDRGVDAVVIVEVEPARQRGPSDGFGVVAAWAHPSAKVRWNRSSLPLV
jgi:hypothetical protein